jgi:hypothetical protein
MKRLLVTVSIGIAATAVAFAALASSGGTPPTEAGPPTDCDESFATFGGLAGHWEGSWMNTTFQSNGTLSVDATINADCTAQAIIEGVFGTSGTVTVDATYRDENGTTIEFQDHPIFGDTIINVTPGGVLTITGSDMHQGIDSVAGTGAVTATNVNIALVLTFDDQSTANETVTLSRDVTPTPSPEPTETAPPTETLPPTETPSAPPTPTATPAGVSQVGGDSDCNGSITARDNQALLRNVLAQAPLSQEEGCPAIGETVVADEVSAAGAGVQRPWGDWDCNGSITARDNQALLRHILSQPPLSQEEGCPELEETVTVT